MERQCCSKLHKEFVASDYVSAYTNVLAVGNVVADFICNMSSAIPPEHLHLVGHSLGAQVAGIAGYLVQQKCQGTIGRITGLDPAGPMFQQNKKPYRLDSEDALLVDVIHTNQGQFGYIGKCGTVDFYPNCGEDQPNCFVMRTLDKDIALGDLLEVPVENGINEMFHESDAYMGESCKSAPKHQEYILYTNGEPPYGRGPQGPLN
ncbi:hypothetical protein ILUMI_10772 [Ignelater luminosus]|uniref:Lipase domain-containing protein n=1 Tax=Ignelater luminosus TaxID=2038154 RepID=A0A8K0CX85_IGNLU|nr:hypothetical protein ILUMI_10772 [Ignelater luminosus]